MTPDFEIFRLSSALVAHASARQAVVARNVAHADTPGYQARDLPDFSEVLRGRHGFTARATRAGHEASGAMSATVQARPVATDGTESPDGNSVTLEDQMIRAADIRRQHDLALGIYRKSMEIFRLGLSRPR
ncbi:MAG: FlgB family protein [Pseudomonadota bacterium]